MRRFLLALLLVALAAWFGIVALNRRAYQEAGVCQVDDAGEIVGRCELPEGS